MWLSNTGAYRLTAAVATSFSINPSQRFPSWKHLAVCWFKLAILARYFRTKETLGGF